LKQLDHNPFALPLIGNFDNHSPEWHEARKGKVGGSTVATLLGLNPWRSALTEYYIQRGEYTPDESVNISMRLGTKLEAPILEIFEEDHPELTVYTTGTYANEIYNINPDGVYQKADGTWGLIEVKYSRDYMKEVPLHYKAQTNLYMGLLGITEGYLVALAGSTYTEIPIVFDQFDYEVMLHRVNAFLAGVKSGERPEFDGSESTLTTMRELNPQVEVETVELGDLGMHLVNAYNDLKAAETYYRELSSRTLDALGSAKFGTVDDIVVCSRQQRGNYAPSLQIKKGK